MYLSETIIIVGCVNAIVFSGVLFAARINVKANVFLGVLILSLAANLGLSWVLAYRLFDVYPLLHLLPFGVSFGLGPLIYLYTRSLCTDEKPNYYHLLFFLGDYPHSLYHLILGREADSAFHGFLDKFGFFALIVIVFYLWLSWKTITAYQSDLKNKVSNVSHRTLGWLKQLVVLFLISLPVFLVMWILLITIGLEFNERVFGHLYYAIAIFWLGIGGIRQHQLFSSEKVQPQNEPSQKVTIDKDRIERLVALMEEEQLYLFPDLDIRLLETKLDLSAKQISEVLNIGLGKNFYRFINEYRVEEFKRKALSNSNLTLYGIAMECGFNSKATFQRVFKEITGMKPSEFVSTQKP